MARRGNEKGGGPIEKVVAGQSPTLVHADKANEVITSLNGLLNMTCEPPDFGEFISHGGKSIFLIKNPAAGGGNLTAIMFFDSVPYYVTFSGTRGAIVGGTA